MNVVEIMGQSKGKKIAEINPDDLENNQCLMFEIGKKKEYFVKKVEKFLSMN